MKKIYFKMRIEMFETEMEKAAKALKALFPHRLRFALEEADTIRLGDENNRPWVIDQRLSGYRVEIAKDGSAKIQDKKYRSILTTPFLGQDELPLFQKVLDALEAAGLLEKGECETLVTRQIGFEQIYFPDFEGCHNGFGIRAYVEDCLQNVTKAVEKEADE